MVVVAIIGLLSSVAVPNFKKYQARAKTSEAKLQLTAIYVAEQSWFASYDNYSNCLNHMGFDPAPQYFSRYYAVGFEESANSDSNEYSVRNGAPSVCYTQDSQGNNTNITALSTSNTSAWGAGKAVGATVVNSVDFSLNTPGMSTPTEMTFVAGALGYISGTHTTPATADAWTIDQDKRIVSRRQGY